MLQIHESHSILLNRKGWVSFSQKATYSLAFLAFIAVSFATCKQPNSESGGGKRAVIKLDSVLPQSSESRREIPILCYHNFSERTNTNITLSRGRFEEQVRALSDSGYHTILPDALYDYLTKGKVLPPKTILITFDDSREAQYTIAEPILRKYGFTASFYIMTVCLDKPNYLSSANLKDLSARGYCIAAHTFDHPMVNHIKSNEWKKELLQPKLVLEQIIGGPVNYFGYPYGAWTNEAIQKLKQYGYKAAFQLSDKKSDQEPLFTIRRLMVHGNWTIDQFQKHLRQSFPAPGV